MAFSPLLSVAHADPAARIDARMTTQSVTARVRRSGRRNSVILRKAQHVITHAVIEKRKEILFTRSRRENVRLGRCARPRHIRRPYDFPVPCFVLFDDEKIAASLLT